MAKEIHIIFPDNPSGKDFKLIAEQIEESLNHLNLIMYKYTTENFTKLSSNKNIALNNFKNILPHMAHILNFTKPSDLESLD